MSADYLVLMARGSDQMNVPSDKVHEYLDDGWKEISRTPSVGHFAPTSPPNSKSVNLEEEKETPKPKGK